MKKYNTSPAARNREAALLELQQLSFSLVDLNLYLDTHPHDTEALAYYNKARAERESQERAKDILICSFGLNGMPEMSLEDLAIKHCITRERVRQIRESSIRLLKSHIPSLLASNL